MLNSTTNHRLQLAAIYLLVSLVITYLLFGDILFHLNSIQLDRSGDGFKNYFSFAYQYRHGSGLWFDGMQYPYGDLLSYADGQPALVLIFQFFKWLGLDLTGNELFIVQALPVLGLIIAACLLHTIISEFKVAKLWTIVTVAACLALSPQLFRFNSHFALAYCFCLPAFILLSLKFIRSKISKINFITACTLLGLFIAFIHPYHLLIASVFLLAFAFCNSLSSRSFNWPVFLSAILPLIIYMLINHYLDPYTDRTQNPYGLTEYTTSRFELLPFYGWSDLLKPSISGIKDYYSEGYCYPGILFILSPVILFLACAKRTTVKIDRTLIVLCFASILCLLFATGIHLSVADQKILELLPPLKQFRSLGRFAWPFYYVAFIALSIITYHLCVNLLSKKVRTAVLSLICILWITDIYAYTQKFNHHIQKYTDKNLLVEDTGIAQLLETSTYSATDFQAIVPIPVPTEGAEKFNPRDNWIAKMKAIPFVYQTGIPMVGCYMSRTSLSRILKQYQLGTGFYTDKKILEDLPSDKDLLMLIAKEDSILYVDLIQRSLPIAETSELFLRAMPLDSMYRSTISMPILDSLRSEAVYYSNFETASQEGLLSANSKRISAHEVLYDDSIDSIYNSLTLSIWYKIESESTSTPFFRIEEFDHSGDKLRSTSYRDKDLARFAVFEDWVQIKKELRLHEKTEKLKWTVDVDVLSIDHALISSDSSHFYKRLENDFYIYDHFIALKDPSSQ